MHSKTHVDSHLLLHSVQTQKCRSQFIIYTERVRSVQKGERTWYCNLSARAADHIARRQLCCSSLFSRLAHAPTWKFSYAKWGWTWVENLIKIQSFAWEKASSSKEELCQGSMYPSRIAALTNSQTAPSTPPLVDLIAFIAPAAAHKAMFAFIKI